jgi:hypothetical protein
MSEPPEDPFTSREFLEFAEHAMNEMVPGMFDSAAVMVPMLPHAAKDVGFAVQLGMAVMLDKPLIILVTPGTQVPSRLLKVADAVVEWDGDSDEEGMHRRVGEALRGLGIDPETEGQGTSTIAVHASSPVKEWNVYDESDRPDQEELGRLISRVWMLVSKNQQGNEALCLAMRASGGSQPFPLMTSHVEDVEDLVRVGKEIAESTGEELVLIRLDHRLEMGILRP